MAYLGKKVTETFTEEALGILGRDLKSAILKSTQSWIRAKLREQRAIYEYRLSMIVKNYKKKPNRNSGAKKYSSQNEIH